MPNLPPQLFGDIWQWLDANGEELARAVGISERQAIKAALREIAKATGSDWNVMGQILTTLSGNKLLLLFTRNPAFFSDIAKIAGRHANTAFYALNADALSELIRKDPEGLKQLFADVIGTTSKSALPDAVDSALFSLSNGNIGAMAVEKRTMLIDVFGQIVEIAGNFAPHLFSAISDANVSGFFSEDPRVILNAYSEVASVSDPEAATIFVQALRKQRLLELFKRNPDKIVQSFTNPAKACASNSPAIFYLLRKPKIAYMLEVNPESFIISLNAFVDVAGKAAELVIPLVFDERVEERFIGDSVALGESFNQLVNAAGKGAVEAVDLLKRGRMLHVFLEKPELVIDVFSSISRVNGEYAYAAFGFLANPRIADMLGEDTGGLLRRVDAILASSGDSAPLVFGFLGREKVAEHFEQDPDGMTDFFTAIGKATDGGKDAALVMLSNPRFVQGFESWPKETMENLKTIADSSGPYAADVLKLLSKDRFAQAITELVCGRHLATCLVNLVESSGKETPMVLRLFESDKFAEQFISDPYREVQIVSHLRSFAGKDFTTGIEILNDPEIASVFSEDPSVLVTTRFRAYVNNATAILGATVFDSMEAILEDNRVKELFTDYVRQEFHGGEPGKLEKELLPALRMYMEKKKKRTTHSVSEKEPKKNPENALH